MKHYKTISELYSTNGFPPPENPLAGLLTFEESQKCYFVEKEFTTAFYAIALTKLASGTFQYGKTKYDHQNGSMAFIKPYQKIKMTDLKNAEKGFLLYIHEDFLFKSNLHTEIKKYSFFDYEVNEALHLSPKEEEIIWDLFNKIKGEYYNNQDDFSREIMITHIDSILKYSQRFYKRQFSGKWFAHREIYGRKINLVTKIFK